MRKLFSSREHFKPTQKLVFARSAILVCARTHTERARVCVRTLIYSFKCVFIYQKKVPKMYIRKSFRKKKFDIVHLYFETKFEF